MRTQLAALLLAVTAVAAGAEGAAARAPVGVVSPLNGDPGTLARLDPVSLRPAGPRLRLGEYHDGWSFSPDRSHLALGMGGAGDTCGRGICIVDVDSMRITGHVAAPIAVEAVAWLRPRRILAVLQSGGIVVADPVTGAIVRRRPLPFTAYRPPSARTPEGLAVVMDARPLRLVVADAQGRVRVTGLRRIAPRERGLPGLAVDRRRRRALVFGAGARVAEVDLRTMRVRYRRVAMPRPMRAPPGTVRVSEREALWLGRGLVVVFGEDLLFDRDDRLRGTFPAGVTLIDTETWTARTLERQAGRARVAAGRLLVYNSDVSTPRGGVGLRVYTRDGRRLVSHLLGSQALDVEVAGDRAYAYRGDGRSRGLHIVHARSGRLIRTVAPPPRGYDIEILGSPLGSGGLFP